jgi:hypothetical protein
MGSLRFAASFVTLAWLGMIGWSSGCGGGSVATSPADDGSAAEDRTTTESGHDGDDGKGAESGQGGDDGGDSGSGGDATTLTGDGSDATSLDSPPGAVEDGGDGDTGGPAQTSKDGTVSTSACAGRGHTSISGRVFDPAGKNPVYNVAVWVPYQAPDPMQSGLTCNCSALYTGGFVGPVAFTDATGAFKIDPAPASLSGGSVPLVIQAGKWRTLTSVQVICGQDNHSQDGTLRLPQGRPGSGVVYVGDLPNLAISTGGADTLECLLTRVGVAESEYVAGAGGQGPHVHIYQGAPATSPAPVAAPQSLVALWDTAAHLAAYDAVLLSCEGAPTMGVNPRALFDYGAMGGRVFASHFHYQWFLGAPFPNLGTWYTARQNQLNNPAYGIVQTSLPNGQAFPEGVAMQAWLQTTHALDDAGELEILQARHNVDVGIVDFPTAIPWMYFDPAMSTIDPLGGTYDPLSATSALALSYDMRGAQGEASCGRIVYSDIHVGGNTGDYGEAPNASSPPAGRTDVPSGCNASVDLSAQEKALEFILFDLTSCLTPPGSLDAGVTIAIAK